MTTVLIQGDKRRRRRHGSAWRKAEVAVRDHCYRRLGEQQAEQILDNSRPVYEPLPIIGLPAYAQNGDFHPVLSGAAGFTKYDDIVNALTVNGYGQRVTFAKASVTTVANAPYSLWGAGGLPAAGAFGTALTGRTRDSSATGAMPYSNAGGGRTMSMLRVGLGSTVALGTILLYDRLAEYPFDSTVTGSSTWGTQPTLPSRDVAGATAGAGVLIFGENDVAGATTTASPGTEVITYTNSGGTGSRATPSGTITASLAVNRIVASTVHNFWWPLQSGDNGVASLQSHNLSASLTSTKMTYVLARPFCYVPLMAGNGYVERDLIQQVAMLPTVYASTCFALALIANTTTCPVQGEIGICEN